MAATSLRGFPIVGIGASAGGLEAFIQVLSKMPADTGMAFVFIQHLDPTHPSLSVDIISRATELKVEEVTDGIRVKPDRVYVIPPNHSMEIIDGVLSLSARGAAPSPNMTIDFFFQSLARSEKSRAIGVVLSGTGTDGTLGLSAIKAEGGVTYAQDPDSAKYQAMPQNGDNIPGGCRPGFAPRRHHQGVVTHCGSSVHGAGHEQSFFKEVI
ncbi:MAG: chemotaxis protein CheB [Calothrix sp. SM1_5_4]|nr:chemotaxis protein CheB [Calothrix sp. SM1_5_4]